MPIETKLTKLLGIRVPVVQGGMQWVGVPKLVAAVSNAGGLGVITALTQPSPDALRKAIQETRTLTKNNFGVNITLLPSITPPDYEGYARAAVEEGVRIFETAGNNPGPLIKYFKSKGCIVIHKCTTIRHAKSAQRLGVDALSIDGFECAGHPGEEDIGGLVLLARAAQELDIPFIASGGFADGRGLASALALGACCTDETSTGTRFMCTVESPIHQKIKEKRALRDCFVPDGETGIDVVLGSKEHWESTRGLTGGCRRRGSASGPSAESGEGDDLRQTGRVQYSRIQ
ncbi:inosine monophosphate dehydrogenase [Dichomitus squalens LYAD-421 SS1]|uniref:Inosine monophosphate dehydrogenase n=1 Tax=Dichomitus squalens (strain LYAD-421) TaxID=732165 RepID=R7SI79_DICSQ|nr:inosine monophosphate dehydrogenase [Dichomitus squalens LYAD-421 SS1]EJF55440.1 inosine monophosphate dehydrogenase [Dichomitus squalens LYAD-421 SS1]